jgi:16S rRNA processing protein RimM
MVVLGKIVDPYGVRGWVRVHPFGDDPSSWAQMPVWWLAAEGTEDWRQVGLKGCRLHGDGLVCLFDSMTDRAGAETLKGLLVGAPREALPATGEDEYYWADLIGLKVVNTAGETLGRVVGLIETGANDVLRVAPETGEERLMPFIGQVVLAVEKENGIVRVEWGSDW